MGQFLLYTSCFGWGTHFPLCRFMLQCRCLIIWLARMSLTSLPALRFGDFITSIIRQVCILTFTHDVLRWLSIGWGTAADILCQASSGACCDVIIPFASLLLQMWFMAPCASLLCKGSKALKVLRLKPLEWCNVQASMRLFRMMLKEPQASNVVTVVTGAHPSSTLSCNKFALLQESLMFRSRKTLQFLTAVLTWSIR